MTGWTINRDERGYAVKDAKRRTIIALDGEGQNVPLSPDAASPNRYAEAEGWHSYTLLLAADEHRHYEYVQANGQRREASSDGAIARNYGLSTVDCLEFILSLPSSKEALLVSFYFSYDVVKMLADVPIELLRQLVDDSVEAKLEHRENAVEWNGYRLEYRPRGYFQVARIADGFAYKTRTKNGRKVRERDGYETTRRVWDIFGFFQKSFANALQDAPHLFDPAVVERIADMKAQRQQFDTLTDERIREYCADECQYLSILMRDMLTHFERLGFRLEMYNGPGAVAQSYYKQRKTLNYKSDAELPSKVALHAYFGGRFEITEIGYVGNAYAYDINSAYPFITASLPCLACSRFRHVSEYVPGEIGVYRVGSHTSGRFAPFPFRTNAELASDVQRMADLNDATARLTDKAVFYAHGGLRYVWNDELEAARKHFGQDAIPVYEGWVLDRRCNHRPFADIPDMYHARRELKAPPYDGAEKVYKLVLNSLYGKLAQSIGWKIKNGKPTPPPYQSFIWAGLITSGTRAMILDAIMQGDVVSIATDGIMSRTPIPALEPSSKELGGWERDDVRDLYLFQSGVYCGEKYDAKSDSWESFYKTRGFSPREIPAQKLIDAWRAGRTSIQAEAESTRFIPMKLGVQLNDAAEYLGQWVPSVHGVKLEHTRRYPTVVEFGPDHMPVLNNNGQPSKPYVFPAEWVSAPYTPKESWDEVISHEHAKEGDHFEATADDLAALDDGH